MNYSFSLHYKRICEKSVGICSHPSTPLGGSYLRSL